MLLHCNIPSVDICNFPRPYRKVLKCQSLSTKCFWKQHHQHRYTKQLKLQHCTMLQTSLTRKVEEMAQQFKRHLQGRGKRWGRGGKLRLLTKDQTNSECINSMHIFNLIAIILIYSARIPKAMPITSILYFCGYLEIKYCPAQAISFCMLSCHTPTCLGMHLCTCKRTNYNDSLARQMRIAQRRFHGFWSGGGVGAVA